MSDGAKVIGQVDSSGAVSILDATINAEVVALARIGLDSAALFGRAFPRGIVCNEWEP